MDVKTLGGFPGSAVVKSPPAGQEIQETCRFDPWIEKIPG